MTLRAIKILSATLLLAALGCGGAPGSIPPLEGDAVYAEHARAVPSPGPGGTGVVYLTLANPTDDDDVLRSVSTPAAKVAEVHETVQGDNGMVRMEAFPEGLPVPAGERVELAPGGKHLMLMALPEPLMVGEEIALTLHLDRAGDLRLTVPVVERRP